MSTVDEIKARIDIVDLVSETVQLRRTGKNYTGFCPFHSNTRTPAFVVFPESGTWRCFGQCNEGGDIFGFVMKKEGWDFTETLRHLAERAGVQLRVPTPQEQIATESHERLRGLLEEAVNFYRHQLLNTPAGQQALAYLHQRGLTDPTIEAFGLGYAPHSWDLTHAHFLQRRYSETDLIDVGLVTEREGGGIYDRFRRRVMFPIRDERGRMTGFGARVLDPEDIPKFLNSPQTVLFDKSQILYGLDRARREIRARDQVVIVEGYLDVIALHQAGYATAVSPMGTALTEYQLHLIKRYTRRIVMALDSDAAGVKATLRGLQIARQSMDREAEPSFDARGLLNYEARLKADIRVTTLPDGMDPDDVVLKDPLHWEEILALANPVVIHVMETLVAGRDLNDPKVKSEIANQVIPLIEDIPDAVERETYRQRLARLLRVDERALQSGQATRMRRTPRRAGKGSTPAAADSSLPGLRVISQTEALEAYCLGVLLRRPDLVYRVDRAMQEHGLTRLSVQDFQRAEHRTVYQLIQDSLDQNAAEPLSFVLSSLSMNLMEKADELLVRTEKLDPVEERVLEELIRTLLTLRKLIVRDSMDHCRFLMEDSQQRGEMLDAEYLQIFQQHSITLSRLDQAIGRFTSRIS